MNFRTEVELPIGRYEIRHADKLMLWGSCFTNSIGALLSDAKFTCDINPFGVLYNPMSIAEGIRELLERYRYDEKDLMCENGQWFSLMHHSTYSSSDKGACLNLINARLNGGADFLKSADWLLITWGTARIYEWKADGRIVGNCHKLPERLFNRRLLSAEEIVETYRCLLQKLREYNPKLQVLFTVSPIRHVRDGMHGNQISKAILLLAAERLCGLLPYCHYFPSYEIMMDELRDYRFYADDMLHPGSLAVNYIWECFKKVCFSDNTLRIIQELDGLKKALEHRPFHPDSDAYKTFLRQNLLKIRNLKEKFPYLDVRKEEMLCQVRLKK